MKSRLFIILPGIFLTLAVCAQQQPAADTALRRELAGARADMRILQEDMRQLLTRLVALERERSALQREVNEQREIIASQEKRIIQLTETLQKTAAALTGETQNRERGIQELKTLILNEFKRIEPMLNQTSAGKKDVAAPGKTAAAAQPTKGMTPVAGYPAKPLEITVEKGDTLQSISRAAGIPVTAIKQANNLTNDIIRIGQKLYIPQK